MKTFSSLLLAAALALFPSMVFADDATPNMKAAYELLDAVNLKSALENTISKTIDLQIQQQPSLQPFEQIMKDFFHKYMGYESLRDDIARVYASTFSESELHELTAFYRTPTGQKAIQKIPELFQQGAQLGISRMQAHLPELQSLIQAEIVRQKQLTTPAN